MTPRGRIVGVASALAAVLVLAAVFGPTAFRVLQAWRHHGFERAIEEARRFEPPWRGPSVAYPTAPPEVAGLDPDALAAWTDALAERGTHHLLLVRGGRLVHEWVAPGRRADGLANVSAVAKATAAAPALGVLVDDGLVRMDELASRTIPAWREDPRRSRITLRMLGNHTSGIQNIVYGGDGAGLVGWEKEFSDDHARRFPLTLSRAEVRFEPGTRVEYSSLAFYALSYALTAALRGAETADLRTLLAERVYRPIGIPDRAWSIAYDRAAEEHDGLRLHTLASGAAYTPRALARIGELFLGGGSAVGRRVLAPETVADLLSVAEVPSDRPGDEPLPAVGWWSNRNGLLPSLPPDAVLAAGASHRLVVLVPDLDLVLVRLGEPLHPIGPEAPYWDGVDPVLFAPLLDAVRR